MSRGRRRTLDLTRAGLLVEALGVARLDDVEGRVDEDLDEREAGLLVEVADDGAVRAEGRDERGEGDARRVREQLRDLHVARAAKGRGRVCFRGGARNQGGGREGRTSPMRRMFSVRDFSSKPRSLFRPKRMLSPSRR